MDFQLPDDILRGGIASGLYSAVAYAVARNGEIVGRGGFGMLSFRENSAPAGTQSVFDVASLTKPVATATSILQLAELGKLHLLQPAAGFFEQEFGPLPNLAGIEIRHLLTHMSGLPPIPQMSLAVAKTEAERRDLVASVLSTQPLRPAGEGFTYSDTGYILLGEIVGRVAGCPLSDWFRDKIAAPMKMENSVFRPTSHRDIAETEAGTTPRAVHDPRARALGGVAGHAGLYSTVDDLLLYAEAIRKGGSPLLSNAAQRRMEKSQISSEKGGQSYGWFCAGNGYLPNGDLFSDRAYGHSGFTGCVLLLDPEFDLSLVLLSNRVLNTSQDGSAFLQLRRRWLNTVAGVVTRGT